MHFKRLVLIGLVSIGLSVLALAASRGSVRAFFFRPQVTAQVGSLDWYAQDAQSRGEVSNIFSAGMIEYSYPETWDDVLADYTFVVAEVVDQKYYPSGSVSGPADTINTWVRLRVIETLRSKDATACADCVPLISPPGDLAAPEADQLLAIKHGGSLLWNGVNLTAVDNAFPNLMPGQRYLLILDVDPALKLGYFSLGPRGAYIIGSSNGLIAINPEANPYQSALTNRYGNSLDQLRHSLNPLQPTSCSPTLEQSCYNRGGEWNSTDCSCYVDPCIRKPWLCDGGNYNY